MDIGEEEKETVVVEPVENPIPPERPVEPERDYEPEPERKPELEPAPVRTAYGATPPVAEGRATLADRLDSYTQLSGAR